MSEIRGSGREYQAAMSQERPRRAAQVQGQGQQPRGATRHPRSGTVAREEQLYVQDAVVAWAQEGLEELSHVEGQEGQQ